MLSNENICFDVDQGNCFLKNGRNFESRKKDVEGECNIDSHLKARQFIKK